VKEDFHLEIKTKEESAKGAARGENPAAKNQTIDFWVVQQQQVQDVQIYGATSYR
jgi:hypothetical protein